MQRNYELGIGEIARDKHKSVYTNTADDMHTKEDISNNYVSAHIDTQESEKVLKNLTHPMINVGTIKRKVIQRSRQT